MIMGDVNAHHLYWNPSLNPRLSNITGKKIEFVSQNNVILLTPPEQIT